ncbi:MAG: TIR domain-containing protein [Butyrivibrio sp.]|nr:TIR domain-containing protein [Butyrivibrio sp.]
MKYDAFISYRHSPLDMEIAKKVHTGLETYKIPAAVKKKTGKKRMGRVFRDQEELPIGSDLGDNISSALAESEYLIVICSPRTPKSYWVCKEIETFIELHDRDHVLAVLVEGEPNESFPWQLLQDEEGNAIEPLAADVRGSDKKERDTKLKTELLRLAAPVIGCTYDELRQRHRERIIKRTVTIASVAASVVALVGAAFGIYNANVAGKMTRLANEKSQLADEKSQLAEEVTLQFRKNQENQSRFYAQESLQLLEQGNREDAVLVAMEGLPTETDDRPYVADSEYALAESLYAYECATGLTFDRTLEHDIPVHKTVAADMGEKLVTIDNSDRVYVWNTKTWERMATVEPQIGRYDSYEDVVSADADVDGIYVASLNAVTKYDYDGKVIYSLDFEDNIRQCRVAPKEGRLLVVCWDHIFVFDPKTGKAITSYENTTGASLRDNGKYHSAHGKYAVGHYNEEEKQTNLTVVDLEKDSFQDIRLSLGYMLDYTITPGGNIFAVSCNNTLYDEGVHDTVAELFDEKGSRIWAQKLDLQIKQTMTFSANARAHTFNNNGEEKKEIVFAIETNAFTLDENTGNIVTQFNLSDDCTMLILNEHSQFGRVGYSGGGIDYIDFSTGRFYQEAAFDTACSIRSAVALNGQIVLDSYSSPELHVASWHAAPDLEEFLSFDEKRSPVGLSDDGEYFVERPSEEFTKLYFYDKEGKELYTMENGELFTVMKLTGKKAFIQDRNKLWIVNPYEKTKESIAMESYNLGSTSFNGRISADGEIGVFWSSRGIVVVDLNTKEQILAADSEHLILDILLSPDKKTLYISELTCNLYALDMNGDQKEFKDDRLRTVSTVLDNSFMSISKDGKYVAICCRDGFVRVVDTGSMSTYAEIPLQTYSKAFVDITDDGTHLVMQGDDYRIRFWDMKNKVIQNITDTSGMVQAIDCDDQNGKIALFTGYGLLLYETESYGCVARVSDGMFYIKSNGSFLLNSDKTAIKRTYYKDYKQLQQEAKKQFPNAQLTEEEKVKYNID